MWYLSFGNLVLCDVVLCNVKLIIDEECGVGLLKNGVFFDFVVLIDCFGQDVIVVCYGNFFEMYECIIGESFYEQLMWIYLVLYYMMGGFWVDYNLMSNFDGFFVFGEVNFLDYGVNCFGVLVFMQGFVDGYFVVFYMIVNYFLSYFGEDVVLMDFLIFCEIKEEVENWMVELVIVKGECMVDDFYR